MNNFTVKKKKLPRWLKNSFLSKLYQSKLGVLVSNWINQGMTYMLFEELVLKILIDIFLFILVLLMLTPIGSLGIKHYLFAFFISHTLNWLLNGHFFNLIRFFGLGRRDYSWFIAYPKLVKYRLFDNKFISAVVLYGSLSRCTSTANSDLDVRVVAKPGFLNALGASWFVFRERLIAFFARYPIDIFMVKYDRGLDKLRDDEPPIILLDHNDFIKKNYKNYKHFEDLFTDI